MRPDIQPQPFSVTAAPIDDDGVLISVCGEVDMATVAELRAALDEHGRRHRRLELDLTEVAFMDSTGLSVLLSAHADAERDGRGFTLRPQLSHTVRRLFEVTGVEHLLELR